MKQNDKRKRRDGEKMKSFSSEGWAGASGPKQSGFKETVSKEEPESYPPLLHTFPFPLSVSLPPSFPLLSFPPPPSSIAQSPTRRTRGQAMLLRCPFSLCGGRGLRPPERRRKSEKRLSSGNAPAPTRIGFSWVAGGVGGRWKGYRGGQKKDVVRDCLLLLLLFNYLCVCACERGPVCVPVCALFSVWGQVLPFLFVFPVVYIQIRITYYFPWWIYPGK